MKKRSLALLSFLVFMALMVLAVPALAGKFHFNSINFYLGSMVFNGDLAGVGNEDVDVTLIASGQVTAYCVNKGGNQAPGHNPIAFQVQQIAHFFTDENGKVAVEVIADDPALANFDPSPSAKEAGCPNGKNWKVAGIMEDSTDWTAARVIVRDGSGEVQIDQTYTCTTSFQNGVAVSLQCLEN